MTTKTETILALCEAATQAEQYRWEQPLFAKDAALKDLSDACNPAEINRMVEGWNGAVDTLKAVRADLLLRAEMDMEDGGAILNISNGVLRKLDEAIAAFDAWQKGEE